MEINAHIYAVADDPVLLRKAHEIIGEMLGSEYFSCDTMEPCAVLPVSRTWYGFSRDTGMTHGPKFWMPCLRRCGALLQNNGAVVISFWSPDHPDGYSEYAYTTPGGDAGYDESCTLIGYSRALGVPDVELVIAELQSGRTASRRRAESARRERKIAQRAKLGDFEIVDGRLKKYRGTDEKVTIPEGVTEIGDAAFVDWPGLTRYLVEDEEYDTPPLEELIIPEGVRKIEDYAVAYCMNLKSVSFPGTLRVIEERAFEGCGELRSIVLPAGLTEIAERTFFLCENLRKVTLPEGLKKIGEGAFDGCDSLKSIIIPAGVEEIGEDAFHSCDELHKVILPEGLKKIGANAFSSCWELEKVILPKSLTDLDETAFDPDCELVRK